LLPSEHTTTVPESGGTTTVVLLFCGAGGLLLLMQPDSAASAASEIRMAFMMLPLTSLAMFFGQLQHAAIATAVDSSALGTNRRLTPTVALFPGILKVLALRSARWLNRR
jgi:hypothetical protein